MRNVLLGAFLVLLYGEHWILALITLLVILKALALWHEALDCMTFIDNADYIGTEEGEYY